MKCRHCGRKIRKWNTGTSDSWHDTRYMDDRETGPFYCDNVGVRTPKKWHEPCTETETVQAILNLYDDHIPVESKKL